MMERRMDMMQMMMQMMQGKCQVRCRDSSSLPNPGADTAADDPPNPEPMTRERHMIHWLKALLMRFVPGGRPMPSPCAVETHSCCSALPPRRRSARSERRLRCPLLIGGVV